MTKPTILQRLLRRRPAQDESADLNSADPERKGAALFRHGRTRMRAGHAREALQAFEQALAVLPNYAEAVAARAEALDMLGKIEIARPEYERARQLWADQHAGAPDRGYLFRQHGRFTFEVDSYELALKRIHTGAFPHLACGNVLLAQGRAAEALACYDSALKIKPNNADITALRGEALSMMGNYAKAIEAFDFALAITPKAPETLNARAIAKLGLGDLPGANADWRRQLELLPAGQAAARACVALRLADYSLALPELDKAIVREPGEIYWPLYRHAALMRLGQPTEPIEMPASLHPAEAAFHKSLWQETVKLGAVWMVEVCAAHNELSRL